MINYTRDHDWIHTDGHGVATVGITAFAQDKLGDLVFVQLPEEGAQLERGGLAAVVESVKAAIDVLSPVSGEVVEVNQAIVNEPALVNRDPMREGWFFKIKLSEPSQLKDLLDEKSYHALIV